MTHFDVAWPWLRAALVRGEQPQFTRQVIEQKLSAQQAQLWLGEGGAILTELVIRNGEHFVHFWLAGGELRAVLELRPGIESWGRQQRCEFASIQGRLGWVRLLKPVGYVREADMLRKRL